MRKFDNAGVISMYTGELLEVFEEGITIRTDSESESSRKYFATKEQEDNKGGRINSYYKRQGSFIWNIHTTAQTLFPKIKAASITRLMFLSTYLGYNGYLIDKNNNPLDKGYANELVNISRREFQYFWKEMLDSGLLDYKDEKIYLNNDVFTKGQIPKDKIKKYSESGQYLTRIYVDGIRNLYNTATNASHKSLSYLFRILPYVNRRYNICCFNPLEEDKNKIQFMNIGNIADVVGYSKKNIYRLSNILFTPKFDIKGEQNSVMKYVGDTSSWKKSCHIFINPNIYYASSKWKEVKILGEF